MILFKFIYKNILVKIVWKLINSVLNRCIYYFLNGIKVRARLLNPNRLINFNMYITVKEANDEFNLVTENDTYEITYLYSSKKLNI
ncbi:hypothetical protein C1I91_20240 [Clostridium manihotivorum]|uniref:Uncharacterized protein n=1 Tax=Clostridium manihotivorum TaxID=2320868 RepID=A0A3R5VAA7_9CLOT|nr:hypothetical protein C1I91_20240 [Clostridium manihotivorum]